MNNPEINSLVRQAGLLAAFDQKHGKMRIVPMIMHTEPNAAPLVMCLNTSEARDRFGSDDWRFDIVASSYKDGLCAKYSKLVDGVEVSFTEPFKVNPLALKHALSVTIEDCDGGEFKRGMDANLSPATTLAGDLM